MTRPTALGTSRLRTPRGNLRSGDRVGWPMTTRPLSSPFPAFGAILLSIGLAACAGSTGPLISAEASGSLPPTVAPTKDGSFIDHPTGATEVVLRFEEGGGFAPIGFFVTQAPQFTLYGDGTVIFRDGMVDPPAAVGSVMPLTPYAIAKLSEAEIQAFLRFALADSGLGVAREFYRPGNIADAPTATFTVHAGGLDKTVSVEALGFDTAQSPDAPILNALAGLGERLRSFSASVAGETVWVSDRFRGVLTEEAFNPPQPWPWTDLGPADFVQGVGPDAPQFPIHTLTREQVDVLGIAGFEGGFSGLPLAGPDGKSYTLALRPILPDEQY